MRLKKSKEPKKYAVGGFIAAGALGALQSALGAGQMIAGQSAASRIKQAPTSRPSEYSELLKQARNAELEQKRLEELNRTIGTGISAAQGAGGRAVIGALPGMVRAADVGAMDILNQRQAQTLDALQFAAQGAENEIARKTNREMMERQAAQAAVEGGLQNISGGLGQIGSAAIFSGLGKTASDVVKNSSPNSEATIRKETLKSLSNTQGERNKIGKSLASLQSLLDEDQVPLLPTRTPRLKDGGMITSGDFSHKTNPIDIVQAGRKVGEMTGGEVGLNPSQQKKLSKESKYFRGLLKKFNKQK